MGRLIDADKMNEELFYKQVGGKDSFITAESAFEMINAQPTAYNVDKVVEQLRKESYQEFCDSERIINLNDAIKVVKAGGIDEEKNKPTQLKGCSWNSNLVVVARAVNDNAELLEEAMQKIDELRKEIELLKEGGID